MARDQGDRQDVHSRIFEMLLEKVREDPFPSTTHLDMLESMLRDQDEVEAYSGALIDKVSQETFPSFDHLRRLKNFA